MAPDFASSVERVMSATDPGFRPGPGVTLDEINETLDRIAAKSSFSSNELGVKVGTKYAASIQTNVALSRIFRQLHSSEAKWIVRMVLKTYNSHPDSRNRCNTVFPLPLARSAYLPKLV
jgi:DNA ligase-4